MIDDVYILICSIDLGNTYCRAAIFENETLKIIGKEYVGDFIERQQMSDQIQEGTRVKQLFFHSFGQIGQTESENTFPLNLLTNVMRKIKKTAEQNLKKRVKEVVMTSPSIFTFRQIKAVKNAAENAGMDVIRFLKAPACAAIMFDYVYKSNSCRNCLLFDLGAGTLSVALAILDSGIVEIVALSGNNNLGGDDFDERLLEYLLNELKILYNKDIRGNRVAMQMLRRECERMKKTLCSSPHASIDVEIDGLNFCSMITRVRFEEICRDLLESCMRSVDMCLKDCEKCPIHEVVLTGGASHMPMIQQSICEIFNGKLPNMSLNLEDATVFGGAIYGSILRGGYDPGILLMDACPYSLGVEMQGGVMWTVISRNTTCLVKSEQEFSTHKDDQNAVVIRVFEGDKSRTSENSLLGIIELTGIPPAPRGKPSISVMFDLDCNHILCVTATDNSTKVSKSVTMGMNNNSDATSGMLNPAEYAIDFHIAEDVKGTDENDLMECDSTFDSAQHFHRTDQHTSQPENNQEDGNLRVPSSLPSFSEGLDVGMKVEYRQRDGSWIPARIRRIDVSLEPPSYEIEITRGGTSHYRDTEEDRLRRVRQ